jgi:hypothetical protein
MTCWNKKCEYHRTGTCILLIAKDRGNCNKKLPEGSKIKVVLKGCGSDSIITEAVLRVEMEVHSNAIMLIDGGLFCTDNVFPVEQISDNEFQINCYLQDAYSVKDGFFIESITESRIKRNVNYTKYERSVEIE